MKKSALLLAFIAFSSTGNADPAPNQFKGKCGHEGLEKALDDAHAHRHYFSTLAAIENSAAGKIDSKVLDEIRQEEVVRDVVLRSGLVATSGGLVLYALPAVAGLGGGYSFGVVAFGATSAGMQLKIVDVQDDTRKLWAETLKGYEKTINAYDEATAQYEKLGALYRENAASYHEIAQIYKGAKPEAGGIRLDDLDKVVGEYANALRLTGLKKFDELERKEKANQAGDDATAYSKSLRKVAAKKAKINRALGVLMEEFIEKLSPLCASTKTAAAAFTPAVVAQLKAPLAIQPGWNRVMIESQVKKTSADVGRNPKLEPEGSKPSNH
jgi:hypothetical protein